MLEIVENFSSEGYENILNSHGGKPVHITEALERGEKTGFIAYSYGAERAYILALDDGGDLMLCDGLVRSVMFKASLKDMDCIEFELSDEGMYENIRKLKFLTGDSRICGNIGRFMNGCADCKHK